MAIAEKKGRTIFISGTARKLVSTTVAIAATTNYAAEDVLSNSASVGTYWTFSDVASEVGGSGTIISAVCICQTTNVSHRVTLYLYHTAPTSNLNDNAANTAPAWADRAGYLGEINFPALNDRGGATKTQVMPGEGGMPLPFQCAEASAAIYGILITEEAITSEVAGASYIISLLIDHNS